ncbi:Pleckstrin homology domain-containing family G member 4B [Labeo rohita]|uniref:Pleckstrin homology domain-containing family G member 4B n=1 Tax=Labeo rohita TaxID=84645 RepID=A0ABQ8MK30_LABRO|nr:Pleckstrin homology domain-containing family G member 4B [Labeo rohita]
MCNRRSNGGLNRTTGPEPWRDSDLHHADVFTEEEEKERMGKSARGPKRFHMHPGRTTRNETQARARQTTLNTTTNTRINLSLPPPQNPSSLDWSIQSALSSLFPPFEATAPTVLSQLFRTIEERYHGDALQCLLNFLIPAKHILESVQQAACAAYSDVLFRCEGWPLCLRDRVVIQLAPINPLLLRPGDFYLQVEPFGEQSARIVLKSLLVQEDLLGQENLVLQAGSRLLEGPAIEETPIPETSYPCIFTESWLREINDGRHGNPLCQCVLSSDRGVVKVPWKEVANPEFLDRPKSNIWLETKTCSTPTLRVQDLKTEIPENESQLQAPVGLLPLEMETRILPANDGMPVCVQLVEGGSRLVKVDQGLPISSFAGKPVGWVAPNTWDSRHNRELEGEYVDLLEFNKEKETLVLNKIAMPTKPLGFKLVRTTQPAPKSNVNLCGEACNPCMQNQTSESMQNDPESKCRYRHSYMAALRNPVNFERASMLPSLEETRTDVGEGEPSCEGYGVGLRLKPTSCTFGQTPNQADRNPMQSFENSVQQKQSPKNSSQSIPHDRSSRENAESLDQHMTQQMPSMVQARQQHKSFLTGQQDLHQTVLGTKALPDKRLHCLNNSFRQDSFQMRISGQKHAKTQHLPKMGLRALPDHSGHRQDANLCLQGFNPIRYSQNQLTQASEQTPPLFQRQILFQNENRPLDYKVLCDDRHCGRGPGSPVQVIKGKSRSKSRSTSSVSETTRECLQPHKPTNRSRSDVYPEIIPMLPAIQGIKHTANLVSPKLNRRQEARKEVYSPGKAGTPAANGVELQKSDAEQLLPSQPENGVQATFLSQDPTIKSLLQQGIICLPGSRDRAGRAVVEVYGGRKGWASSQLSPQEFCRLLLYLHSVPRMEVRELGMTIVIDSRKCPLPSVFYKSLLMVQEQALHAVHTILMLVDKDANPRPEKHPGLQIDVVTSLKALHKTVDGQQLTSDLGGTFPYSHEDWLQFHQKLSLFQLDLQAASSLLQTAIRRLDVKKTNTAKDVQSCIQEQRSSMKMVLEDTRLVALQREGGSILARMRKEESRFAQSEDFRDSLESVTCLYNQVEEAVHTLVMKSNQSLQHLEHVLLLRETEDSLSKIQKWCDEEEQSWQKDKDDTEKTLLKIEQRLQEIQSVLIQAKEKNEKGMSLIKEVDRNSKGTRYPETDAFQHIKSSNAPMCACLSTLKAFEERFKDFSPQHFQDKSSALLERHPDGIWMWNAVWAQCRDIRQRLTEILQASYRNQKPLGLPQKDSGAAKPEEAHLKGPTQSVITTGLGENEGDPQTNLAGGHTETQNSPAGQGDNETVMHFDLRCEPVRTETSTSSNSDLIMTENTHKELHVQGPQQPFKLREEGRSEHFHQSTSKVSTSHNSPATKLRKCRRIYSHSDSDLRKSGRVSEFNCSPHYKALVRSRSEGSCLQSINYQVSIGKTAVKHKVQTCAASRRESDSSRASWDEQSSKLSHQDSFCSSTSGLSQSDVSEKFSSDTKSDDHTLISPAAQSESPVRTQDDKLQHIMEELLQTEREYVRALGYVVENYIPELERPDVPQDLRGQRGSIFGNLEKLRDFHQHHFLQELELCLKEPFCVGRCFLKHKENFGLYALYSKNKPRSERLLIDHGREFFKQKQQLLGDKMDLSSYLLKPVQRISKYGLLLQDMLRECDSGAHTGHERIEIQTALEMIQKKKCYRHIFLFQDLILFSKTRRTDVGNDTYIYKQSFKTSDIGMTHNSGDSGLCFEIWFRRRKSQDTYVFQAPSREVKENWTRDLERILWEQAVYNREIRMQERVFMGIGHKPFMDIQPSEMAINDRAINCTPTGRGGIPVLRLNSVGSASCTSSSGSHSSSSSGWGSTSPVGHLIGPSGGDIVRYVHGTSGILEEDDLDQESGNQSTLVESSVSSGESVSCFSSSGQSCSSVIGGDCDHGPSEMPVIGLKKPFAHKHESNVKPTNPPGQTKDHSCTTVQGTSIIGKSTEV